MKNKIHLLLGLLLLPFLALSQQESKFGITLGGYVKNDVIFDTRQTVALRQGHFLLFPKNEQLDSSGTDINARNSLHILAIQSRLKGTITTPDVLGAKVSGYIEAEFFGNIDANINTLRLRQAFIKVAWPKTELMLGQFWHALFITDCYPLTESFNTGAPFQPFSRNPQVRLTQTLGHIKIAATALSQIDFVDNGPEGLSSVYLRNAVVPELNLTISYNIKNETNKTELLAGVGGDYKRVVPRLVTVSNYGTNESVSNLTGLAFLKVKFPAVTLKFEGIYGQDLHNLTMIGGYAVQDITDLKKDIRNYTPINTISLWTDIHTNGEKWQGGIFAGYTQNMGSNDVVKQVHPINETQSATRQIYYSRGSDIANIYRVAPRILFSQGKLKFSLELEYTAVAYGIPDEKGVVQNTQSVSNLRILFGTYLFF